MAGNQNSGRKAKEDAVRTSIVLDAEIYNYLSRNGNLSAEVERLAYAELRQLSETQTVSINKRSILGWNYSTEQKFGAIAKPEEPGYIGTYNQIIDYIVAEAQGLEMKKVQREEAWFVKVNGEWRRMVDTPYGLRFDQSTEVTVELSQG
jgi:hypothetical protein